MAITADLAQTFFVDGATVKKATHVFLDKINLFFQRKPSASTTTSGLPFPGVTIYVVETQNNSITNVAVPTFIEHVKYGKRRLEWSEINTSNDGQLATEFSFYVPVPIKTNVPYAILIKFDGGDKGYALWRNKAGETYGNITSPAITKGALDGYFFTITNGNVITPQPDVDLKFSLSIAKFDTSNTTFKFVNRNYEIIEYKGDSLIGEFIGGEYVFANTGYPAAQTVSVSALSKTITGTGTTFLSNFTPNQLIVLNSGTDNDVRRIVSISSGTQMTLDYEPSFTNAAAYYMVTPVGQVFDFMPSANIVTLIASTANVSHNFLANSTSNTIVGAVSGAIATVANSSALGKFNIDEFNAKFKYFTPVGTGVNTSVYLANSSYTTVPTPYQIETGKKKRYTFHSAFLYSRTDEALNGNGSIGLLDNEKSINFNCEFSSNNEYVSPLIDEEDLIFHAYRSLINSDLTNEHKSNGNAVSKYISKRITLAPGQDAEDLRVYVTAFRPSGTDVKIYAKLYNDLDPQSFENRDWSLLETITPFSLYSNPDNIDDVIELEYKLYNFPVANTETLVAGPQLTGTFTGSNGSANLVCTTASPGVNTEIVEGDVVRVYNKLFPNNSLVSAVLACNTSTLTLDTTLSTSNTKLSDFVRSGLVVEKVTYKSMSFNNYINDGVVKYYNANTSAFETYNTFAFKIVLTGLQASTKYPLVKDIRGIALSI